MINGKVFIYTVSSNRCFIRFLETKIDNYVVSFQGWWVVRSCPIRHLNDWVAVTLSWIQCCVFFPYFLLAISAPTLSSFFSFSFFFSCLMYVLMAACSICNCNNCLWVSHLHHQILIHPPMLVISRKREKNRKRKRNVPINVMSPTSQWGVFAFGAYKIWPTLVLQGGCQGFCSQCY